MAKRRKFTSRFKTEVVLESLKERHTMAELAQKYKVHPQQIREWKKHFLKNSEEVFSKKVSNRNEEAEAFLNRQSKA